MASQQIDESCIFCKIANGKIETRLIAESEFAVAFADQSPRQPVHILVVPRSHFANFAELALGDSRAMADLMALGARVASEQTNGHHRFTFNTGTEAGQSVFHAHGHITSLKAKV